MDFRFLFIIIGSESYFLPVLLSVFFYCRFIQCLYGIFILRGMSSSREKEAAWDFASYLAGSMEGAEANKRVKCRQLTYFGCEHGTEEYRTLEIEGFGNQDIGNYVSSELMSHRKERPLSSYDLELDEVFHLTIDAIIYEPELTPEELYAYFLRMLKKYFVHEDILLFFTTIQTTWPPS